MKFLILGNMSDLQSGLYITESLEAMGHSTVFLDTRRIMHELGVSPAQEYIMKELKEMNLVPDVVLVLKGMELTKSTVEKIKVMFKDAKLVNWFFDAYMEEAKIWEHATYRKVIPLFDYFICSLKGVADKLRDVGHDNAYYVDEGCYPPCHEEQYMNSFQKKKYGTDVAFIGSLGYDIHGNRLTFLDHIAKEGFRLKIWGKVVGDTKKIPVSIRPYITRISVINEDHSMVAQSSLINIGIDQDSAIDMGHSARAYRIMCAGGLYLSTITKGLQKMFKLNKQHEEITADQEIVVFYDTDDLTKKIDFLLEHDDIRESIAKNGQKLVKEKHKFSDRLSEMLEIMKVKKNE